MIDQLLPWLAAIFSLLLAYPWVRWLLILPARRDNPQPRDPLLTLLLTVGLSLGALTWLMMLLAALAPALLSFWRVTALGLIVHLTGWAAWQRRPVKPRPLRPADAGWWRRPVPLTALIIVLVLVGLTLFNAAYWPFGEDDTLTIYGPVAFRFATTGQFSGAGLYDAYPVLGPLAFAYVHLAAGVPNEYAARFVVAALALVTVGGAYVLGRDLYGRAVGLTAAFLTITTPILTHWAASGYTDLPAGAYYVLTAVAAWRLFTRPHPAYAALTGLLAGLAAFTKNGALLLVGSLVGWVLYSYWVTWRRSSAEGWPIRGRHAALMAGAFALIAGPWYGHTLLSFGYLVPPTGWIDQAQHTLAALFAPLLNFRNFMLGGLLSIPGMAAMLWELWRSRWHFAPRPALLVGFSLPFWGVWWWFFSYDPRFLLMIWPLLAVMSGWLVVTIWRWLPERGQRLVLRALPFVLIVLALPAARMAVDHKPDILRDPFMDDLARHRVQLGERYDVARWLQDETPPDAAILLSDYWLYYHVLLSHPDVTFWPTVERDALAAFDYWVVRPDLPLPDWADAETVRPVFEAGGYIVYEVLLPEPDEVE